MCVVCLSPIKTRDDWAVARRRLAAADETNKRYLHLVDTALFVLCLDHTSPCTAAEVFGVPS